MKIIYFSRKLKQKGVILKKFLINIFQIAVLILLILVLIFSLYSKFIIKNNLIKLNGMAVFVVLTGSMEPQIEAGEMILIKECNNYKIGDIVTYCDDDFFITHRITQISDKKVVTKGDNNNIEDHAIELNQIQGKVVFHSKILGFFILYLLKPITIVYILFCLFKDSFISLYESKLKNKIIKIKEKINKKEKETTK
jgi:signal peptidase